MWLKEIINEARLMGSKGIAWFIKTKTGRPPIEVDVHEWNIYKGQLGLANCNLKRKDLSEEELRECKKDAREAKSILDEIERRRPDIKAQSEKLTPIPKRN